MFLLPLGKLGLQGAEGTRILDEGGKLYGWDRQGLKIFSERRRWDGGYLPGRLSTYVLKAFSVSASNPRSFEVNLLLSTLEGSPYQGVNGTFAS